MQIKAKIGQRAVGRLSLHAVACIAGAAFLVALTPAPAAAQFMPWGSWGNPKPWKPKPRVRRRAAPQYVEPTDQKPAAALPKPTGPLVLVVSLNNQTVTVYDDGRQIAKSKISSGTRSNPTPTGVFSILEKNRHHYSNLYNSAPMPFMQRLTNSGIALHAGDLPGYPASHGCIRLPYSFARSLFGITDIGARVIVSNEDVQPSEFDSPALIEPLPPEHMAHNTNAPTLAPAAAGAEQHLSVMSADSATITREQAAARRAAERERLALSIVEAENAKSAADDQVKAAADAAKEAKELANKEKAEESRLVAEARKVSRTASAAEARFKKFTQRIAKVDPEKLDGAELEKQSAEETAEEDKAVEAMQAAADAERAAEAQKQTAAKAAADAAALEKARRIAIDDAKHAETLVGEAKLALAGAEALEERKDRPVSVFISGKTGRLVAKLGFVQVMDVPITITDASRPLGTHVMTALAYTDGEKGLRWSAVTMPPPSASNYSRRKKRRHADEAWVEPARYDADPAHALERIDMPLEAEQQLAELMKPGSSIIISDYGLSRETSERTEFVVEPWRSRPDSSNYRYY